MRLLRVLQPGALFGLSVPVEKDVPVLLIKR